MPQLSFGRHSLHLPPGYGGLLFSDSQSEAAVQKFILASPDYTLYHLKPYLEFARTENGSGDVLLLTKAGQHQVALPLHFADRFFLTSGYSGLLFPDTDREQSLRSAVETLRVFQLANRSLGYKALQSVQALAYRDSARMACLECLLAGLEQVRADTIYSRVLGLRAAAAEAVSPSIIPGQLCAQTLSPKCLENKLLATYDGDVRNQIRQAIKNAHGIEYYLLEGTAADATCVEAYDRYLPIHLESWRRTGLPTHPLPYWHGLSKAVQKGGGADLVVLVSDKDRRELAGVTCHLYRQRAIYWSGCSTAEGKAKRANPLCLHSAVTVCAALGIETFELGRFAPAETDAKQKAVDQYKAQFRGQLLRVVNFQKTPATFNFRMRELVGHVRAWVSRSLRPALAQRRPFRRSSPPEGAGLPLHPLRTEGTLKIPA